VGGRSFPVCGKGRVFGPVFDFSLSRFGVLFSGPPQTASILDNPSSRFYSSAFRTATKILTSRLRAGIEPSRMTEEIGRCRPKSAALQDVPNMESNADNGVRMHTF